MKIKLPFTLKDYPINSYFYFYRKQQIQVDPKTRKPGEKKYFWDYTYCKCKVTHHVVNSDFNRKGQIEIGLVGVEGDNSNEGFDPQEFRNGHNEGFFIIPEWLFLALKKNKEPDQIIDKVNMMLNDGTGNVELNNIVRTCKTETKRWGSQKVSWNKYQKNE